jgi:RpiB/LacA/LacB family sugar-phosphate isomerase
MRIAIGCDHAGFMLKIEMIEWLRQQGHEALDFGSNSTRPVDYPDFARAVGEAVAEDRAERGIVICGSGVGACIAVNKMKGLRAGTCHDTYSARQGVEHDDMNVLCLGARIIGSELAKELIAAFLKAEFTHEPRHERRLKKILAIEASGN